MKLLVDIGNTRLKSALLQDGVLVQQRSLCWRDEPLAEALDTLWQDLRPSALAVASVAGEALVEAVCEQARRHWSLEPEIARVQAECAGLRCGYPEPERLGVDRWLAMLGAWVREPTAWLVADLGTAATLDVVDAGGQHLGGCIYAGIETQRQALSRRTAQLPEVDHESRELLARETSGAIALGTLLSVVGGVRELHDSARAWPDCRELRLGLTGGAAAVASERLAPAHELLPDLVLEGLAMSAFGEQARGQSSLANGK